MRKFNGMLCLVLIGGPIGCTTNPEVTQYEAALRQATTCEDVLDAVQEDAIAKVELELESFINQEYYNRWGGPVAFDDVLEGGSGGAGGLAPPTADGANGAEAPSGFSDTNRQVGDVDEADIVKVGAEGLKLYVIRGNGAGIPNVQFHEFDSWPASQMSKVADLEIEGGAIEMFVEGDRAVVFSNAYGVEALDDGDLCQGYYGGGPEPALADIDGYYYCGRSFVKITVIDLSGDTPKAVREVYVDGWYTSSRRHGSIVRAVVQSSMQRPGTVPYLYEFVYNGEAYPETREAEILLAQAWAVKAKEAIRATALKDWVPVWGERVDGEIQEQPVQCSDFYSPAPGLTNYGLTQIVGLDIESDSDTQITSILGQASQVYANGEAMVLTQPDWTFLERGVNSDRTAVHRFAVSFDRQRTPYQGSGFVQGTVNDQFSIDELAGIIRIATTRTTWPDQNTGGVAPDVWVPPTTDNLVSTLRLDGNALELAGSTPPLAEGERIFSARFIGDLAYIVTFRQVDPLFAIDLSNPESPKVLGELKIPGFSDYMHPLEDDHLLTIGRDIDEDTQRDNGTALQIFDVSDPANPRPAYKVTLGEGYSEANHNHKAFNFYADKGLLAFPFVSYQGNFSSTLELWDVTVKDGFKYLGAVDHSDLVLNDCGGVPYPVEEFYYQCGYQPQITRGVFISGDGEDFIYSISHGGVRVHNVSDLTEPVATATY
ncbi:MAG: beta-propeller domain-containing protein [Polyangiales bacterium]